MMSMMVREAKAHDDVITSIQIVELKDFSGVITGSKDKIVRNFNLELDLLGSILS